MNSLFDPLGFVIPVILEAKLIYRLVCDESLEWHKPLPDLLLARWKNWISTLSLLKMLPFPDAWK